MPVLWVMLLLLPPPSTIMAIWISIIRERWELILLFRQPQVPVMFLLELHWCLQEANLTSPDRAPDKQLLWKMEQLLVLPAMAQQQMAISEVKKQMEEITERK